MCDCDEWKDFVIFFTIVLGEKCLSLSMLDFFILDSSVEVYIRSLFIFHRNTNWSHIMYLFLECRIKKTPENCTKKKWIEKNRSSIGFLYIWHHLLSTVNLFSLIFMWNLILWIINVDVFSIKIRKVGAQSFVYD